MTGEHLNVNVGYHLRLDRNIPMYWTKQPHVIRLECIGLTMQYNEPARGNLKNKGERERESGNVSERILILWTSFWQDNSINWCNKLLSNIDRHVLVLQRQNEYRHDHRTITISPSKYGLCHEPMRFWYSMSNQLLLQTKIDGQAVCNKWITLQKQINKQSIVSCSIGMYPLFACAAFYYYYYYYYLHWFTCGYLISQFIGLVMTWIIVLTSCDCRLWTVQCDRASE